MESQDSTTPHPSSWWGSKRILPIVLRLSREESAALLPTSVAPSHKTSTEVAAGRTGCTTLIGEADACGTAPFQESQGLPGGTWDSPGDCPGDRSWLSAGGDAEATRGEREMGSAAQVG